MKPTSTRLMAGSIAASALLAFAPGATATEPLEGDLTVQQELEKMRSEQAEMRARIEQQQKRIDELENRPTFEPGGTVPRASLMSAIDEYMKASDLTVKGSSSIKFYGFARLDYIWTDSRFNNTETAFSVLPEDPTVNGGIKKNSNASAMSPRLTRFGMNFDAGRVNSLGADVSGKIEIDFYNSGLTGQAQSRSAVRMRHAYGKLDWDNLSVLVGQTSDLISPLYPSSNPDLVMWGAGNLGDRIPQVRGTWSTKMDEAAVTVAGMLGATGSRDGDNFDGNAYRDGETSGLPTMQARIGYGRQAGEDGRWAVGVWGHRAEEDPDLIVGGEREYESVAVGVDVKIKYSKKLTFQGEWFQGRNLDDVRGGALQGVNVVSGDEIHSMGYWAELQYHLTDTWRIHGGFTKDNPTNEDVGVGGINENRVWYTGHRWNFDPVELGLDYMYWFTKWNGSANGRAHRVQAYFAYKF